MAADVQQVGGVRLCVLLGEGRDGAAREDAGVVLLDIIRGEKLEVRERLGREVLGGQVADAESFEVMEPEADAFRNYVGGKKLAVKVEEMMLDRASLLGLSVPEMVVLIGGLRVLGANHGERGHGHFTKRSGQLTNDFFVNLLGMTNVWKEVEGSDGQEYVATDRAGGYETWRATRADLIFGSNSELRAVAEVYAENGHEAKFVEDFVAAWTKVMEADRFDLKGWVGHE